MRQSQLSRQSQRCSFCEEMPFDCLPVMCHEISGQGMTSQLFSPLPDNCVKGSLGFRPWEVLPEDGDQWQPVCVSLSYYFDVLNDPKQTSLSFSPLWLMTVISPRGLIQSLYIYSFIHLFNFWPCCIFIAMWAAEAPELWLPDAKSQVTGKALMLGKIEGRKRKGSIEDEIFGWPP